MLKYLADIWHCRYFWLSLAKNDLQLRYRRSVLGIGWSLLQPLATTIVMCAVFHAIFHMNLQDHGLFILSGLACWSYITRLLNTPIAGRSAAPVASSCSDMLAGLSKNEILSVPPAFWAKAVSAEHSAISRPPMIVKARRFPIIGCSFRCAAPAEREASTCSADRDTPMSFCGSPTLRRSPSARLRGEVGA